MKTTAQIASENFRYASNYCFFRPACPTFTKPNTHNGYGAILKLLSDGGIRERKAILEELGLPSRNGYYASVFQKLLWSKLIRRVGVRGYYMITQLGRDYVAENLKHDIPAPKRHVNKVCAPSTDDECFTPAWKTSYDAAMVVHKAAMDVCQTIMSQLC